jgi:DNA-directed RNA polymerase specialized sigma24 family protein
LGVPNGTVKAQLARARKRLRQLMRNALSPRPYGLTRGYGHRLAA